MPRCRPSMAPTRSAAGRVATDADATRRASPKPKIEELLKEGQDVLVQVAKEPLGTKGARLTSHVTHARPLPGLHADGRPHRHLPQDRHRARSARGCAASSSEFREQHGFGGGVIIRTAAADRPKEDILARPELLPQDLGRDAAEVRAAPRPGRRVPGARASSTSCCATC